MMIVNNVPLWSVTTWDKKYNAVDKTWQPQTIKYKYLLSDELDKISVKDGNVRLLYTGKDIGYTTETLAGDALSEGEIVAIPWGGTPSVKYFKGKFVTGDNRIATSNNPEELLNKYLYYYLLGNLNELSSYYRGAGLKHPSMKDVLKMRISYPSVEVQKRIIKQFDLLLDIVEMRKLQLQQLDELVKARFVEMFGDPETNPYGWEQITVGDVCSSIVRGPFGSALKKEFFVEPDETTYKVYEQKHAIQKSATIGTYYVTAEKFNELKRFECVAGDILMSCSGTMGELYQLPIGCEKGLINQALCKFTLNDKILPIVFLTYMKQTIGNLETKGSGIQNIAAVSYVKAMPINLPPLNVQTQFVTFVEQVDKSKFAVQKALDEAQTLFDSLMQEYFG